VRLTELDSLVVAAMARTMRLVVICNRMVALVHCRYDLHTLVPQHRRQQLGIEIRDADGLGQLR